MAQGLEDKLEDEGNSSDGSLSEGSAGTTCGGEAGGEAGGAAAAGAGGASAPCIGPWLCREQQDQTKGGKERLQNL